MTIRFAVAILNYITVTTINPAVTNTKMVVMVVHYGAHVPPKTNF